MATAKKLPSGNYRVLIYTHTENGKKKYKSFTDSTPRKAELAASKYLLGLTCSKNNDEQDLNIEKMISNYIESKSNVLSPSTIFEYKRLDKSSVYSHIKHLKGHEIKNHILQSWVNTVAIGKSPKYVRNIAGLLTAVLSQYLPDFKVRMTLPQAIKPVVVVPEEEQVLHLMRHVQGTWMESAIILGSIIGLRRSEICALRTKHVDIKNCTLDVKDALVRGKDENNKTVWVLKTTKTLESTRLIKIPELVAKRIVELAQDDKIVPVVPDTITNCFGDLRDEFQYSFSFHKLRHYNSSIMHYLQIPEKSQMRRLGHASNHMAKKVYQHELLKGKDESDTKLDTYFSKLIQHEIQHK